MGSKAIFKIYAVQSKFVISIYKLIVRNYDTDLIYQSRTNIASQHDMLLNSDKAVVTYPF